MSVKLKKKTKEFNEMLEVFGQRQPTPVLAVQFDPKRLLDFEPDVHLKPGAGTDRSDQGGYVFQGTDDKEWPVEKGDWIVFCEMKMFPSYFAPDRNHSFVMSDEEFQDSFGKDTPPAQPKPELDDGESEVASGVGTEGG